MKNPKLKRLLFSAIIFIMIMAVSPLYADISAMTVLSITPPNPAPGDLVSVQFSYCTAAYDTTNLILAVSTNSTMQPSNTAGQTFKVNADGIDIGGAGDGEAASNNAGLSMSDSQGTSHCQTITWNIHIPNTLTEGSTYYIVIAGKSYDVRPDNFQTQGSMAFTTPPPATGVSITKTAEMTTVQPGDKVLYTIDYNQANSSNLIITDQVPPNCTLISQSLGGTNSGTTAGSTLSWSLGSTVSRVISKVWYIVQVDAAAPPSTPIDNIAHWVVDEIPAGGDSNDALISTGLPFSLIKTQYPPSPAAMVIGDSVTYTVDFHAGGEAFYSYDPFDTDISGFHDNGGGGVWSWVSDPGKGGYLHSIQQTGYPHYLRNTPADFCFGEIEGDIYILNGTNNDGLIAFRDGGTPGSCAYGVGISPDGENGSASTALWVQKFCGAVGSYTAAVPATISINNWYTEKILVTDVGNLGLNWVRIQAKVWPRGTAEPAGYTLDWTDMSGTPAPCGYVGFQGNGTNANNYDNLKIIKSNQTSPVVYDTIPNIVTYDSGSGADATHSAAVNAGGMVSWNIYTSFIDQPYSFTWVGTINYCGDAFDKFSFKTEELTAPVDSNGVSLNVAVCPETYTDTPTFTSSPTPSYTRTFTATFTATATPSNTPTFTPSFTATKTSTPTCTATPSATATNTPIIPKFALTKTVNPGSAGRGDTVTYTIHYENTGLIALTAFEVWDTVPAQIENVANVSAPGIYNSVTGVIDWVIGAVPNTGVNSNGDLTFTGTLKNSVNRNDTIGNVAVGYATLAASVVASNQANVAANVPLFQLTPVTNYPNPFNGDTTIVFDLTLIADSCSIKFFTISGELVKTMDFAEMKKSIPGGGLDDNPPKKTASGLWRYRVYWNGENKAGNKLSSGVYIYQIKASCGNEQQKAMSRLAIIR